MARISRSIYGINTRFLGYLAAIFIALLATLFFVANHHVLDLSDRPSSTNTVADFFAEFPIYFYPNQGEYSADIKYFSKGYGYDLQFLNNEIRLDLAHKYTGDVLKVQDNELAVNRIISLHFVNGNSETVVYGEPALQNRQSTEVRNDTPAPQRKANQAFAKVVYHGIYPGVDAEFYGLQKQISCDFILQDDTNPDIIRIAANQAGYLSVVRNSVDFYLQNPDGSMLFKQPKVYYLSHGVKTPLRGTFQIHGNVLSFVAPQV